MSAQTYKQLLRTHMQAENAHQMEEILGTLTPDCFFEDMALGQYFRGHVGAREYYQTWWDAFSTTAHPEHVCYTDQAFAVAEVRFQGTHIPALSWASSQPDARWIYLPLSL